MSIGMGDGVMPQPQETTMDPNACLTRLLAAIDDNDSAETVAAAGNLLEWLLAGGARPTAVRPSEWTKIGGALGRIADALCEEQMNGANVPDGCEDDEESDNA